MFLGWCAAGQQQAAGLSDHSRVGSGSESRFGPSCRSRLGRDPAVGAFRFTHDPGNAWGVRWDRWNPSFLGIAAYEFTSNWGRPWVDPGSRGGNLAGDFQGCLPGHSCRGTDLDASPILSDEEICSSSCRRVVVRPSNSQWNGCAFVAGSSNFKSMFLCCLNVPSFFGLGGCPLKIYTILVVETGISPPVCTAKATKSISICYLYLYADFCEECLKFLGE